MLDAAGPTVTLVAMRSTAALASLLVPLAAGPACNCGLEVLATPLPHMIVQPKAVEINTAPVAQDTTVVIQVSDPTIVNLEQVHAELQEPVDPSFRLVPPVIDEVLAGQTGEITVVVRPSTASELHAVLVLTAEDDAKPNRVEVPFIIHAVDVGLPDICDYPEQIAFGGIGQSDIGRDEVTMDNCGVRDLIIDSVRQCKDPVGDDPVDEDGCGPDDPAFHVQQVPQPPQPETAIGPGERGGISLPITFSPGDLVEHDTNVMIKSNDPDENPLIIPVSGTGAACPTACIEAVDGIDGIQPFDTVRLDGGCSTVPEGANTSIEAYQWTLSQQPLGSTTTLSSLTDSRVELPVDLAGNYCVNLTVTDTAGAHSCAPASQCFQAVPTEDLHIQLVWDSPTADLDLHLVGDGGDPFKHESDCYFSNRHPTPDDCPANASRCSWVDNADQNPNLDHDDNDGYGPENTNIVHPAPGSHWRIFVHYWNAQTDGDPRVTATVRVFVYGQQVLELQQVFENDQTLWQAVDIVWPEVEGDPARVSQIGNVTPFPRPF